MKPPLSSALWRQVILAAVHWMLGLFVGGVAVLLFVVDSMPDLDVWHQAQFRHEYNHQQHRAFRTLQQYQTLEQQLFQELQAQVYDRVDTAALPDVHRFHRGSPVDPTAYTENWNRSREFSVANPRAAVLLLHGLSDSPYSLRQLAQTLHASQSHVVLLRLPGHGTAPAALTRVSVEDFKAAVRLAARHLRQQVGPDVPLFVVGYSNGGALAVEYALAQLAGEPLPELAGLVLISPAMGVSRLAVLASWQRRLSYLPGLGKLAWQAVQPEFDPYKYNSFPLNAAEQVYDLTQDIAVRLEQLQNQGRLGDFPPTLVFSSAVDATVSVSALIDGLMMKLASHRHRLVLYDVHQRANSAFLFTDEARQVAQQALSRSLPFTLDILSNGPADNDQLVRMIKPAGTDAVELVRTDLQWPDELYSLSHVALPFAPWDRVYGDVPHVNGKPQSLGNVTLRGERGILQVPINQLMRLRYNPFYAYQETEIHAFILGQTSAN